MPQRPHARYTREKTWAALYRQHINAGYALVPYSATNNSIAVIRCKSPDEVQQVTRTLLQQAEACAAFYSAPTGSPAPDVLKRAVHAVILAKSSDYYRYQLADHPEIRLVVCGLHDSYLHLPVLEMRTNQRYSPRQTAIALSDPDFDRLRRTAFGHSILLGALINGDAAALAFLETLPAPTRRRINHEKETGQVTHYQGRPLAFLNEAQRVEIGAKISAGLKRYYETRPHRVT